MIDNEIKLAQNWLLNSGIQNVEGPSSGGVNSWFDMDENGYTYVYSEITGYGITTLLYLKEHSGSEEYLARAVSAAEWLSSRAEHAMGPVKTRYYYDRTEGAQHYSFESENIYAFDNGMVLYGLINLFKSTQEKKYLEFSERIANFLLNKMAQPDGSFFAVFNAKTGATIDNSWKWSSQSGSFHAKLALGFTDLYDVTKNTVYKDAVLNLCRRSLDFQERSGRFITSREDRSTHLHPHCYSAEGLLYAGMYFDEKEFLGSAVRAVEWALDGQRSDGGVPKMFKDDEFLPYYRSDTLAQVLRLGVILHSIDKLDGKYAPCLGALKDQLLKFQYNGNGPQSGGFFYGQTLDGEKRNHLNSWCTMFALQALLMYSELYENKKKLNRLECFV